MPLTPAQRKEVRDWMDSACKPFKERTLDQVFDSQYDIEDLERQFVAKFAVLLKEPKGVFNLMLAAHCKAPSDERDGYDDE